MTDKRTIMFDVNGIPRSVTVEPGAFLADVLRDHLGLMGTKKGCGGGECGACTVLVNGAPIASCIFPAVKAHGCSVETVEGLGSPTHLHPLQSWFLRLGAVQCGFCTPGVLMSAKALLDQNSNPTEQEIREALCGNLCRCTGYQKIIEAIGAAAREMRGDSPPEPVGRNVHEPIGRSLPRVDGLPKVLGTAQFAADLSQPGMLHAAMVVSPHAHAAILSIDAGRALAQPGVVVVLTARDLPGAKTYGILVKDTPFLAIDKVRYVGEPVAIVVAEDERLARAAAARVQVRYETLPAIFDPLAAMMPDAVRVHDSGNISKHAKVRVGNAEEASLEQP